MPLLLLLLLAIPAIADPALVFSVSNMFDTSAGIRTGSGAPISVTGIDTPLHAGVTVSGGPGGFNWNPSLTGSDANNRYFQATDIIIEAQFNFSDGFAPVPIFFYYPIGETQSFAISQGNLPLAFTVPIAMPIDPRLAAFYGLAPPCSASTVPVGCSTPDFPSGLASAILTGQETGSHTFSGEIIAAVVPEPATVLLITLAAAVLGIGTFGARATGTFRNTPLRR
jgi:hypothetical protein